MAEKEEKKKEKIAQELHTPEKFENLYGEWLPYHRRVEHPVSGKEVSIQEILTEELTDIVEGLQKDLKERIKKKDARDSDKIEKEVMELAKKVYMASHGITEEPEGKKEKENFNVKVKEHFLAIAREATGADIQTYEQGVAEILAADNPIYGKGDQRSKILDALLQAYAQDTHESDKEPTKGLRIGRLGYLRRELSTKYYTPYWHEKHETTLRDEGYKADFDKSASGGEIMGTIEELLSTGKANTKKPFIKAETHRRRKPTYESK